MSSPCKARDQAVVRAREALAGLIERHAVDVPPDVDLSDLRLSTIAELFYERGLSLSGLFDRIIEEADLTSDRSVRQVFVVSERTAAKMYPGREWAELQAAFESLAWLAYSPRGVTRNTVSSSRSGSPG